MEKNRRYSKQGIVKHLQHRYDVHILGEHVPNLAERSSSLSSYGWWGKRNSGVLKEMKTILNSALYVIFLLKFVGVDILSDV
mmetsp:Transcript_19035/g.35228  ORF Transcript_19035/g.35228 Transcript_19035/m.35228 type:complete len:82 (+) Transcript_19035:1179-1424(+)